MELIRDEVPYMTKAPVRVCSEDLTDLALTTEAINKQTGKQIDAIRDEMRISKKEMAEFFDLSYGGLNSKLAGRRSFQFSEMVRLANWWGMSLDDLAASALGSADCSR